MKKNFGNENYFLLKRKGRKEGKGGRKEKEEEGGKGGGRKKEGKEKSG